MNFEEHNTHILYPRTSIKPHVNPTCWLYKNTHLSESLRIIIVYNFRLQYLKF